MTCYCLEEIIAEKLRTLLQTHEKLITRGWNRPRSRDYYDLWQILTKLGYAFKPEKVVEILYLKNEHRNVSFSSPDDFLAMSLFPRRIETGIIALVLSSWAFLDLTRYLRS